MTVKQLIQHLALIPEEHQGKDIALFWDSSPRGEIEAIYFDPTEDLLVLCGEWRSGSISDTVVVYQKQ